MKRPLIAVLILFVVLGSMLTAWTWYSSTRSTVAPPRITRRAGRPTFEVAPKQRAATKDERQGAVRSIQAQLDAFRRDDYQSAVRYQSQALRRNFASTAAFQEVIQMAYPQFARYKSVTFGTVTAQGEGKATQVLVPINLVGQDGVKVQATYIMVKEKDIYCVNGVSGGSAQGALPENQKPKVPPGFEGVAPLIT